MHPWKLIALTAASLILAACGSTPPAQSVPAAPTNLPTRTASETPADRPTPTTSSISPPSPTPAPSDTPTIRAAPPPSSTPAPRMSASSTPTSAPVGAPPAGGLPDLVVTAWYYSTEPLILPCMDHNPALAVRVCVANIGTGAAGPFAVIEPGEAAHRWDAGGLNPGEELCQDGLDWFGWGPEVVVDPYNAVTELHEENNTTRAGIPTQHPQCTPTP